MSLLAHPPRLGSQHHCHPPAGARGPHRTAVRSPAGHSQSSAPLGLWLSPLASLPAAVAALCPMPCSPAPSSPYSCAFTTSLAFVQLRDPSLCLSPHLSGGPSLCLSPPLSQGSPLLTASWLHCLFAVSWLPHALSGPPTSSGPSVSIFISGLWGLTSCPAHLLPPATFLGGPSFHCGV